MPKTLYGQMFEDISSGDRGLYAEFGASKPGFPESHAPNTDAALLAWHPINAASLSVIAGPDPLSSALPNFLRVMVPTGASGSYLDICMQDYTSTYDASFYYRFPSASDKNVTFTVGLQTTTGKQLASSPVTVSGSQTTWTQIKTKLTPEVSPSSTANNFTTTLDGAAGLSVDFALLSLLPPTFKGRENGLRIDIAEVGAFIIVFRIETY
ncbi:hypothetical protein H0H81_003950 [Sphagnurus paluster]|uniref:Uncharacterized protein n=1 Tax=Sphagnurus paluster TaxID=117069 RepID=A0A9P7K487_9AGAR|nr:hypothetical protein H0H81_003950 [Sphagnurus paluster]